MENKNINNRMKMWLDTIKIEKNPDKVIEKFKELFKYEYETIYEQEVDEYYECYTTTYILSNQIEIEVITGDWDKFGSLTSHMGYDIHIYSKGSKVEKYRNGITIFSYNEYKEKNIKDLENLLNEDLEIM